MLTLFQRMSRRLSTRLRFSFSVAAFTAAALCLSFPCHRRAQ
jgi:hypothetical protein